MSQRVTLDDTDIRARLRSHSRATFSPTYAQRPLARTSHQLFQDINTASAQRTFVISEPAPKQTAPIAVTPSVRLISPPAGPRPFEIPPTKQALAARKPQRSQVLMRHAVALTKKETITNLKPSRPSRSTVLTAMAATVFLVGITVSLVGFRTNNVAQAQVEKINKQVSASTTTGTGDASPPGTTPVNASMLAAYTVAPELARYIRIPKLGVDARVLQVGVTSTGALATPTNVFDTAWYKNSAKPGQPGATLIDGHVSSWTTNGVFYGIKDLRAGDTIEIEKGDGSKLEYTVNKMVAYDVDKVDMQALVHPVTSGTSGLNLITCGGKYDSKAGEFTQRIAVFATLNP